MAIRKTAALFVGLVILTAAALGQSLGDVARTQQQKQNDSPTTQTPKVITNDDLDTPDSEPPHVKTKAKEKKEPKPGQKEAQFEKAAARTKAAILAQKTRISNLQAQIDKQRASIRYIEVGVPYENQLKKQQAADRMQQQLEQENQKLQAMQEAARHAGFGNVVYNP